MLATNEGLFFSFSIYFTSQDSYKDTHAVLSVMSVQSENFLNFSQIINSTRLNAIIKLNVIAFASHKANIISQ